MPNVTASPPQRETLEEALERASRGLAEIRRLLEPNPDPRARRPKLAVVRDAREEEPS